ncbi:glycerol-3-phosphatase [Kozakia baliensis]|uniref:Glycerol-3-phosphatase n=1 Tax=Kozakia baliensis TaxID=153496 RepID=A0A1D8UQB8_9PROT|nr:glycerol-3-phosphatase [Kozakia baliensis]
MVWSLTVSETRLFPNRRFDAFLFDMDGTILTSIVAAERVWARWAERHGLDVPKFLPTIHGVRTIETIRRQNLPAIDPEAEARAIIAEEMEDTDGIEGIKGAAAFLSSLPPHRWAIVTSASRDLALTRIKVTGLPMPDVVVTGDDVSQGKPAPDCFQLGAKKLGFDARDCAVFEDAVAGITAGEAAGAGVVVITATHSHDLNTSHPKVQDYQHLRARPAPDGKLELFLEN